VPEFGTLDVIWSGALLLGNCEHFADRNVDEFGKRIDEAADQPGAGYAIDLGMLARDPSIPDGANLLARGQACIFPARDASLEIHGIKTCSAQCAGHALAGLASVSAVGHHGAVGREFDPPMFDVRRSTMICADDQSIVGQKGIVTTNVINTGADAVPRRV